MQPRESFQNEQRPDEAFLRPWPTGNSLVDKINEEAASRNKAMASEHTVPVLGVMPKYIWMEKRCLDLAKTISHHCEVGPANYVLIGTWVSELHGLLQELYVMEQERKVDQNARDPRDSRFMD